MVKSSIKIKRVVTNKPHSHNKKKSIKEIIENKIVKYSKKTHQPFVSRFRLFEEVYEFHKNKTLNQIKFYLKNTLIKLLEERVLIKHRDSYRFSKVYLNKEAKKLKKLKEKQKKQKSNEKNKNKMKVLKNKDIKAKVVTLFSSNSKAISKEIQNIKSTIDQKILNNPNNKLSIFKNQSSNTNSTLNRNDGGSGNLLNATTTKQINKSIKKGYKRIHPAIWQYFDINKATSIPSPDGWYNYDAEASDIVEDAWQRYIVNRGLNDVRSVTSGEWEYMVDFMNWNQTNILHSSHTKRNIRRMDEKGNITKNPYQ